MLERLLDSLDRLRYPRFEVIVVDDGSTDGTAALMARRPGIGLGLIYLYQPWSKMGAARNRGLQRARGEIVAFTDDDCVVDPMWLGSLAAAFGAHPGALGVQGKTVMDHAAMTPFTRQVEQLVGGQPYRTCNIAYRLAVLRDLGGFDTHLIRGEDVLLGARVMERGSIVFAPDAVVEHPPRPKEWADRRAWRTRLESELHFKKAYRQYAPARSQTLSVQRADHVVSRWVILPLRRYWRWHLVYLRRHPREYARHVPLIVREKAALLTLLPFFLREWRRASRLEPAVTVPPPVSVVVVTGERPQLLTGLLEALRHQTCAAWEVVVVDTEPGRGTREAAESARVRYVPAIGAGLGAARQAGVEAATGEIIAFTDDDCLPDREWLQRLVERLCEEPRLAGVQGATAAAPGPVGAHAVRVMRPNRLYQTCNIAYRREALLHAGGFDTRFRGWFEDTAMAARVLRTAPIGWEPRARVVHRAMPRRRFDRQRWTDVLADERLLASAYPEFYRRTRGPGFVLTVITRWLLGAPFKTLAANLPGARHDPRGYALLLRDLLGERRDLLLALRDQLGPAPKRSPYHGRGGR